MLSWAVKLDGRALWSENAVSGVSVYGEQLRKFGKQEYRRWDPNRSKLGAGIMRSRRDKQFLLPEPGSTVLYLGAGHGTSVSLFTTTFAALVTTSVVELLRLI